LQSRLEKQAFQASKGEARHGGTGRVAIPPRKAGISSGYWVRKNLKRRFSMKVAIPPRKAGISSMDSCC